MTRSAAKFWWKRDIPKDIAYYASSGYSNKLEPVYYSTIIAEKNRKQNIRLFQKRYSHHIKPCFIWVFKNDSFLFSGWWVYIKTLKKDTALNFRENREDLLKIIVEAFPTNEFPEFQTFESWCIHFCKNHPHVGFGRKKNQGLLKIKCLVDSNNELINVIV